MIGESRIKKKWKIAEKRNLKKKFSDVGKTKFDFWFNRKKY